MITEKIIIFVSIAIVIMLSGCFSSYNDYCSICDYNYCEQELYSHRDPGNSPSFPDALQGIWEQCNFGKKMDIEWLESLRIKYNLTNVYSFTLINYSNICPTSPNLKWMDTGYIQNIKWERDVGYHHIIDTYLVINNNTYHYRLFEEGDDFPKNGTLPDCLHINRSHLYFVYKQKHEAWHWAYKGATIIDATSHPYHADDVNASWNEWRNKYAFYLQNGGIDIGDDYWM